MGRKSIHFSDVGFVYDGAPQALFQNLTMVLQRGWTGVVGANGVGKTTLLKLISGDLEPSSGRLSSLSPVAFCQQRTDRVPSDLEPLLQTGDAVGAQLRGRLGLRSHWASDWENLSHGERKRAQLAVALWSQPAVLLVDEPTNHIDHEARRVVQHALSRYSGVGLVVSHDRQLLDTLCGHCLIVEPPLVRLFAGGYSSGRQQMERQKGESRLGYQRTGQELQRLRGEATRRRRQEQRAAQKKSRRGIKRGDSDSREKANRARLSDGNSGARLRQLDSRLQRTQERLDGYVLVPRKKLGISIGGQKSNRSVLLSLKGGGLQLGPDSQLRYPELYLQPGERVALTGPNGCGKSSFLEFILQEVNLPMSRVAYLPQELEMSSAQLLLQQARALSRERLAQVLNLVSRLGSRPEQLLASVTPSPGEARKLLMAMRLEAEPHLVILDEPTNHLDLPSIECLEQALSDCQSTLVLVSHDDHFLQSLTGRQWQIQPQQGRSTQRYLLVDS